MKVKKKIISSALALSVVLGTLSTGALAVTTGENKTQNNGEYNSPSFNVKKWSPPSKKGLSKRDIAFAYLGEKSHKFKLKGDIKNIFKVIQEQADNKTGTHHFRLMEQYKGIPIFGSDSTISLDKNNDVTSFFGEVVPNLDDENINTVAKISENDAIATAKKAIEKKIGKVNQYDGDIDVERFIYEHDGAFYNTYLVKVSTVEPKVGYWHYFIDAANGNVVDHYNASDEVIAFGNGVFGNKQMFEAQFADGLYGMYDATRGKGVVTNDAKNSNKMVISAGLMFKDGAAVDAHANAQKVYDYFKKTFDRNSVDNNGQQLISAVHVNTNWNNASWNGRTMSYGDGDGVLYHNFAAGLDVAAHEMTHGVTQHTANLVYRDESGALNESISDIFAAMVDRDDHEWLIGEKIVKDGRKALRSMSNPAEIVDIRTVTGYSPDHWTKRYTGTLDSGGVHINSSINNKAAYLISEGGKHYGISVKGVGREATEQIYYRALSKYLTSSSDFKMMRQAATLAAIDLYGSTSAQVKAVENAYDAVGVYNELKVGNVNIVPLQVTGSPKDRLNLIIFGDGYTPQEMDKFRQDVERNQNVQWSVEPFRSYRYYFNVYMVETPSKESGISCDPDDGNVRRDTVLGLEYATKCPAEKLARGITYSSAGNTARTNLLSQYVAPALGIASNAQNIQTLALANTFTYGGIGGVQATTSGGSPQGPLVSTHELGHSLGNLQDEYPYSSREIPGTPHPNSEPSSVHHTRMTSAEMMDKKAKWWRWLGEESESGGIIRAADPNGYESGSTRGSNVWRPSEHSMMRWLGFYFDQVGREQMTQRITGMRNANAMPITSAPVGEVGSNDVVWVETMHPRFHALDLAWEVNGKEVANSHNSRFLKLSDLNVKTGDTVKVTVKDKTEFVRDPSFLDGPRMTQTRQWTVGKALPKTSVNVIFNMSTPTNRAVAHDEVVFVETPYPNDRVLNVTWTLNGEKITETNNSRLLDLGKLNLPSGSSKLTATLTDPAGSGSDTMTWTVDNGLPTAPRTLSEPLTTLADDVEHNVYFNEFDVLLKPEDDQPGFVVGELRLNKDGWFNYFGFPEKPVGTPFKFSHSGSDVKALTYGNLGKGGPSKATFEQSYTAKDPGGAFVPGFGTHLVEHRALDATGNIGNSNSFKATVLPGNLPTCTTTLTGNQNGIDVTEGVICLKNATVDGEVTVHQGASLVVFNSTINGSMHTEAANAVQMFGTTVNGPSYISGTVSNVTLAGNKFNDDLDLSNNNQISANKQYGEYGPIMAGNYVDGSLYCIGNSSTVTDFGAGNDFGGTITGQCRTLNPKQPVVGAEAYKHTEYLSEKIGTRVTGTANEEKAGTYLFDEMEKLGFQPIKQKFSYTTRGVTTNTANIIGVRKGNSNNTTHKQIIVGAHYDSVNVGKGADDNASSIGVILETAKALQKKNLEYDIKFIFFGAEETGTRGSNYYVSQMSKEENANTVAMINLDSLLAGDKVYAYGSPGAKGWIRDLAFDIADKKHIPLETNPGLNKSYPKGTTGDWSDHAAFQKAGIPIGYLEATNWEIGDLDGYTQTVKHGGIWHTKNDNLAFLEKEFPGRVEAHLEQFTLILTGLLTNIEKVKKN